ncbi:MAG: tRNA dihydrouridine synthase DusB [Brucellaceae bacterium]|nr:tRNA dihydrouridine synthase DusB [Brucellaceae bacterium]
MRNVSVDILSRPLRVGTAELRNRVLMAPMSGVSDRPMRDLALAHGAGAVVSEMVASSGLVSASRESARRSERGDATVHIVQLAGRQAQWMGEAARIAEANGADIIDINMGCPAKKVIGGYSGAALMRDLDHALTLIEATVAAVSVPVTLKMRLGWDRQTMNAPDLAQRAVDAGVQAITVHGRTRDQFYKGRADWQAIRAVRDAVSVPLIANGDVETLDDAAAILAHSGADAVMIGRAHYGRPWQAGAIAQAAGASAGTLAPPAPDAVGDYVLAHHEAMLELYGVQKGLRHARKHLGWYLERFAPEADPDARRVMMTGDDVPAIHKAILRVFGENAASARLAA